MAEGTVFENRPDGYRFYVYVLARPDVLTLDGLPTPFYIGMGTIRPDGRVQRMDDHEVYASSGGVGLKCNIIRKLRRSGLSVLKSVDSWHATHTSAWTRETFLISLIGRKDIGTGPLANATAGGEGAIDPSPETRELISANSKRHAPELVARTMANAAVRIPRAVEGRKKLWASDPEFRRSVNEQLQAGQRASRANRPEVYEAANAVKAAKMKARFKENPDRLMAMNVVGRAAALEWRKANPEEASRVSRQGAVALLEKLRETPGALEKRMKAVGAAAAKKRSEDLPVKLAAIERCRQIIASRGVVVTMPSRKCWSKVWTDFERKLLAGVSAADAPTVA